MSTSLPDELGTLLAMVAHDLRNPLSALLTNINYVRGALKSVPREIDGALADAGLSCSLLAQLIGNLDVLSAVVEQPAPLRRSCALRDLVNEAIARIAGPAALGAVGFDMLIPARSPLALVDPVFMARALDNLLANALQFSPVGGSVTLICTAADGQAVLVVADDGPIVAQAQRASVLTAAGQITAKYSAESRYGRGLALYCAAEAARLAGALLVVAEHNGRSAFRLSMPAVEPAG